MTTESILRNAVYHAERQLAKSESSSPAHFYWTKELRRAKIELKVHLELRTRQLTLDAMF